MKLSKAKPRVFTKLFLALAACGVISAAWGTPARTPEAIRAEMKQLSERMAVLARELHTQSGESGAYMLRISPDGGVTEDFRSMVDLDQRGAALGVVLNQRSGGGIEIGAVTPGSGAEKAGVLAGDVLISVRGKALPTNASVADTRALIGKLNAGDAVALGLQRGSKAVAVTATATQQPRVMVVNSGGDEMEVLNKLSTLKAFNDMPELRAALAALEAKSATGERSRIKIIRADQPNDNIDLDLTALNPDLGQYFGTSTGVLALAVEGYAPLLPGDVIISVNGQATANPQQVFAQFTNVRGKTAQVRVMRKKVSMDLSVLVPVTAVPPPPAPPAPPVSPAPSVPPPPPVPPQLSGIV